MLLHLDHAVARARQVRHAEPLRDDPVEAERLEPVEPAARLLELAASTGESRKPFATRSSSARRSASGRFHTGSPSQSSTSKTTYDAGISADSLRIRDSAGMEPHLHRVEVERAVAHDHDLAVERRARRQQLAERPQLREVAQQRPLVPRPERELALQVLEHAAEAVPLRLVRPAVALGKLADELGLHRRERQVRTRAPPKPTVKLVR